MAPVPEKNTDVLPVSPDPQPEQTQSTSPAWPSQANQLPVSLTFENHLPVPPDVETADDDGMNQQQNLPESIDVNDGSGACSTAMNISPRDRQPQRLPCFIRPLASHIQPDDVEYLDRKGALTIPEDELRDELLKVYVHVVYPFMPAVDLGDLLTPIIRGDGNNPVSLLLFQAVMFIGVAFVNMDHLRRAGFQSRQKARKTFFSRVRFLHSLECEQDRFTQLQALLLMTYWYDGPDDEKDTWYWSGLSLSLAQVLGLHRDHQLLPLNNKIRRLRRRVWWSCFMRDRLVALGIRRPARIRSDDFNAPLPTLDDYEFDPLPHDVMGFIGKFTWLHDIRTRKTLAVTYVELAKLCVHLGRILLSQYSVLGKHPVGSEYFTSFMVVPKKSPEQVEKLAECDAALEDWHQNLDAICRYKPFSLSPAQGVDENGRLVHFHQAVLHMIYLTTIGALHRPQAFQTDTDPTGRWADKTASQQKVSQAAIGITELAYDLQSYDLMRYLSTTSVPALVSAILIHLLDTRSVKEDVRNLSIGRFYQCMQALEQFRDMYASADYAVAFLKTVIRNIGIKIPIATFGAESSTEINSSRSRSNHRLADSTTAATDPGAMWRDFGVTKYPTPSSFSNPPHDLMTTPPTSGQPMVPAHSALDTFSFGASTPAPLSLEGGGVMPSNSNWSEMDNLLSAMMTFEPGRNVFPQTMNSEQLWLGDYM
jgi:hypothetical protein